VNIVAAIIHSRCLELSVLRIYGMSYDTLASKVSECGLNSWVSFLSCLECLAMNKHG
jgi:hypothetical protein